MKTNVEQLMPKMATNIQGEGGERFEDRAGDLGSTAVERNRVLWRRERRNVEDEIGGDLEVLRIVGTITKFIGNTRVYMHRDGH